MRIVLLTPARRFIGNQYGLGYQIPLGIVMIGGPLVDAGHTVRLIDNDLYGWDHPRLIDEIRAFAPDCIMLGHTGSTAAHDTCLDTARALRAAFPTTTLVYGGIFPSYAPESTLRECPAIDIIVRGEAEQIVLDLTHALESGADLHTIDGIAFREGHRMIVTRSRPPIQDLDQYRTGWELVDWPGYNLLGMGRAAGMQFSRGCPLTCTYCGQWMFWKKWRHRSPANLIEQFRTLAEDYGVKIVWLADENFSADREVTIEVLDRLIEADLNLSLNINMTAADVVRDADLLPRYKQAGVDFVVMGVESLDDDVVSAVRKNNPWQVSQEAVRLLRQHDIISLVDIIFGLEDETLPIIIDRFRKLHTLDADILNAVYLTPHFWTAEGRATDPQSVIQLDQSLWTYRNQVIATPHLSPLMVFLAVKLTEGLFHIRPKSLWRLLFHRDSRWRTIMRAFILSGFGVVIAETAEFLFATQFVTQGSLRRFRGTRHAPVQLGS